MESRSGEFHTFVSRMSKLVPIHPGTDIFEVGAGSGWFLIHCALEGMRARGLELHPELASLATRRAIDAGVEIEVAVGDVQVVSIEPDSCDIVVANSVLEHVRDYDRALANIYRGLRPGGLFVFNSTNKFALRSGEYPDIRLYGWLPYGIRERIRVKRQGADIVTSSGMDFHQFTHPGLRRALRDNGFARVVDLYDLLEPEDLNTHSRPRVLAVKACKSFPVLKPLITMFANGTHFYCDQVTRSSRL